MCKRIIALVCFSLLSYGAARAVPAPSVFGTYEPLGGAYLVTLVLDNRAYGEPLSMFGLYSADVADVSSPTQWRFNLTPRDVIWSSEGSAYNVQPGGILAGFAYTAQGAPGTLAWLIWSEPSGGHGGTVTPTFVPEPKSLLALGGGILAVGLPWLRRRRAM